MFDVIVIGSGAAGMISSIVAAREGKKVLLLEKNKTLGNKLKATGGGRCNLTNKLPVETFMAHYGRNGKFMRDAMEFFSQEDLIKFFDNLGVKCDAPDGFRVFPVGHNSKSILDALQEELTRLHVKIQTDENVNELLHVNEQITGVKTDKSTYKALHVILATGGIGYPKLGTTGEGHKMAKELGHKITPMYPAMLPLKVKETWVSSCKADTIPKVKMFINLPKYKKLNMSGDLIFTNDGIRGPVVLDFAREITPLLEKFDEVPLLVNLTQGKNEDDIRLYVKKYAHLNIEENLSYLIPNSLVKALCKEIDVPLHLNFKTLEPKRRDELIKLLVWTPLSVIGDAGIDKAMITRGGISLKEINPKTMESKKIKGLYVCGEIVDLDGRCGGYNLQWAFSSGFLAGHLS